MKKNLRFVIVSLVIVLFAGCGKDDKSVTSVTPPSFYTYGAPDSTYLNAIPRSLEAAAYSSTENRLNWVAPVFTTNLTGYRVYSMVPGKETIFSMSGDVTNMAETVNVVQGARCTVTYRITSLFSIFDTVYNFYSEVESLPSNPVVLTR